MEVLIENNTPKTSLEYFKKSLYYSQIKKYSQAELHVDKALELQPDCHRGQMQPAC